MATKSVSVRLKELAAEVREDEVNAQEKDMVLRKIASMAERGKTVDSKTLLAILSSVGSVRLS